MNYTGNENHDITLQEAALLTEKFRSIFPQQAIIAEYFGKSAIESVLDQANCVGLRIYYGLSTALVPRLVIVGVVSNGDDMTDGIILELGRSCPPDCSSANALNS
jgi:hypothetical protein